MKQLLVALALFLPQLAGASTLTSVYETTVTSTNIVTTSVSSAFPAYRAQTVAVQVTADVNTPVAKTAVDTAFDVTANTVTIAAHGFTTGLKVGVASDGTLPDPLTATDYYAIVVSANTIKLATSLANALAGTAVDLIDQGSAAQVTTFTPTAIAGGAVKLQKSNDGESWTDEGSPTAISADATVWLEKVDPTAKFMRLHFTLTAGRLSGSSIIFVKGPAF